MVLGRPACRQCSALKQRIWHYDTLRPEGGKHGRVAFGTALARDVLRGLRTQQRWCFCAILSCCYFHILSSEHKVCQERCTRKGTARAAVTNASCLWHGVVDDTYADMLAVAAGLQCRRCSRRECQQTGLHRVWTLAVASYNVLYCTCRRDGGRVNARCLHTRPERAVTVPLHRLPQTFALTARALARLGSVL